MSKYPKKLLCLSLSAALALGAVTPQAMAAVPAPAQPAAIVMDYGLELELALAQDQLESLAAAPTLPAGEAQETEGGLPLAIILALAGSASAMGFYLFGVLVQKKPFSAREFARRGGCGAMVGLLGRFIAGRSAAIRIFGSGATGMALAACFGR